MNLPLGVDELLDRERAHLHRLTPDQAARAVEDEGALLVDIRYGALRDRDGVIPGAVIVERNELEWRLDPHSAHRIPQATRHDLPVVVVCNEGYASSLAARSLQALGLRRATDLVGGFQGWAAAGLPVTPPVPGRPSVPHPSIAAIGDRPDSQ
ncbi:rhodanese-related sulfurtransferase [Streptacidiphilus sp. EB129]